MVMGTCESRELGVADMRPETSDKRLVTGE
jgi:hypothetical protein